MIMYSWCLHLSSRNESETWSWTLRSEQVTQGAWHTWRSSWYKLGDDHGVVWCFAMGLDNWVTNLTSGLKEFTHFTCYFKSGCRITVHLLTRQGFGGLCVQRRLRRLEDIVRGDKYKKGKSIYLGRNAGWNSPLKKAADMQEGLGELNGDEFGTWTSGRLAWEWILFTIWKFKKIMGFLLKKQVSNPKNYETLTIIFINISIQINERCPLGITVETKLQY